MKNNLKEIYKAIQDGHIKPNSDRVSVNEQETHQYLNWVEAAQNETSLKFMGLRFKG